MTKRLQKVWREAVVASLRASYNSANAMAAADNVVRGFQSRFPEAGEPEYK